MATRQTPEQQLTEARKLAYAHNMFVVDRQDKGTPVHILYRRLPTGQGVRLGKSRSPSGFRRLVAKCAGVGE